MLTKCHACAHVQARDHSEHPRCSACTACLCPDCRGDKVVATDDDVAAERAERLRAAAIAMQDAA